MTTLPAARILRLALAVDAASCLALGAGLALAAEALSGPLGLPVPLLRAAGLVLLPAAAVLGYLASRSLAAAGMVWLVVAINIAWAVESFALLAGASVQPTALGSAFVFVQAVAVLLLAAVEGWANRAAHATHGLAGPAF